MSTILSIPIIGKVHSTFSAPANPGIMREAESLIEVDERFAEGLYKIELSDYIEVYFHFDKAEPYKLTTNSYTGEHKGVFATRSPRRPSKIGSTIVKLLERNGNRLRVQGLDAIDGTPLIDIKPIHIPFTEEQMEESEIHGRKVSPRKNVLSNIWAGRTHLLLLDAAQMHGHYCPGLAMGVMMAAKAMQLTRAKSDGLEDLLAIVETNNCVTDGIQFVTGCTFGNNAMIFNDVGKTAFTLARRNGAGVRIATRAQAKEYMRQAHPLFTESYKKVVQEQSRAETDTAAFKKHGIEKAFATLELEFDKLFKVEEVTVEIPQYAPSHPGVVCAGCGEQVMATRIVEKPSGSFCIPCAGEKVKTLTGHGIV